MVIENCQKEQDAYFHNLGEERARNCPFFNKLPVAEAGFCGV